MLVVLLSETKGTFQIVLGEELCTVEIVEFILAVIPSAHVSLVLQGMAHHLVELVTTVAVLGGSITDGNSFRRLRHGTDVKRESLWMGQTESPHLISNRRYLRLLRRIVIV